MVFKTVAGTRDGQRGPGIVWKDSRIYNERTLSALDVTRRSKLLYKNSIALGSNWSKFYHNNVR